MKRVGNGKIILFVLMFVILFQFISADKMRENVSVPPTEKTKDLNNYSYVIEHGLF